MRFTSVLSEYWVASAQPLPIINRKAAINIDIVCIGIIGTNLFTASV
jgi:hypothetical protein